MPPPEGFQDGGPFSIPPPPDGFQGEGGFFAPPEGFDDNGIFFVPPEGVIGDAIFLPPPPEGFDEDGFFFPPSEGVPGADGFVAPPDFFQVYQDFPPPPLDFVGDWQPPPPQEWDGASDWMPPPADDLYADGAWFPPPPPQGWQGEWFPPPPPPEGVVEFPGEFFFSDKFDDFFTDDFFVGEGFDAGPPPFEAFPFDAFLEDHSLHEIIPGTPPQFTHGAFGNFDFGAVPPPPAGFAAFPPPPEFLADFGDFGAAFGPPRQPGAGPDADGAGPPPDLPPEFFQFQERLADLQTFLQDFPPPPADGTAPPDDGTIPPGDAAVGGAPSDQLAFLGFDDIADLLPDDFLPPDQVAEKFDAFGQDHPLIGEGGVVNPELETAMLDHPPVPEGFDGFDFSGDHAQFDDMFSVYDEQNVGTTQRGQVNSTLNDVLEDGTKLRCSDTTVLETVQGEAMPLVEMAPGVYQTQWVVNIRQLTTTVMQLEDPLDPAIVTEADQSREVLSQMTWTMVMQEVDTDGDGVPDEMRMSGSNHLTVLSDTVEGGPPAGFPPLPTPPPMVLGLDFEGVLDLNPSAP